MQQKRDEVLAALLRGNVALLILSVVRDQPRSGVEIARVIDERCKDLLRFKQGTLYAALHHMERDGLLSSEWSAPDAGEAPQRRYRLTAKGTEEMERRLDAWQRVTTAVSRVTGVLPLEPEA